MPLGQNAGDGETDPRITATLLRLPSHLYRYVGVTARRRDWLRKLLVDSVLHFARPSLLNDPFDCRIQPSFKASSLEIDHYWRGVAKREFPHLRPHERKARMRELQAQSKTPNGRLRLANKLFDSYEQEGIACFSKAPTKLLLWSYYAEGHTGVVVRFDTDLKYLQRIPSLYLPIEVSYRPTVPATNFYKSASFDFISAVLGTKALEWQHEEEWRLLTIGRNGDVRMPSGMVNGVILGLRTDASTEQDVRQWITESGRAIELQRIIARPGSFELTLQQA